MRHKDFETDFKPNVHIIVNENDNIRYEDKVYLKQRHLEVRVQYLQVLYVTESELEEIIKDLQLIHL